MAEAEEQERTNVYIVPFLLSDEPEQSHFAKDTKHRIEALLAANYPEVIYGEDWRRNEKYQHLSRLWPEFNEFWKPYRTTFASDSASLCNSSDLASTQTPTESSIFLEAKQSAAHAPFGCTTTQATKKSLIGCEYCGKAYVSPVALKMHVRTHTLPCKCELCGKAFSRAWILQGHVRTHTGEKPFSCPHCGRAFADRSNLRAHLQTHSEVKKYRCKTCSKTFSRMPQLLKHEDGGCAGAAASQQQQQPPVNAVNYA